MNRQVQERKKQIKEGFVGQRMIIVPQNIKQKIPNNILLRNFYLTSVGHYPKASYHDRERKTGSTQYILIYCVEGGGYIYVNNVRYELIPNTYFIIPKNTPHRYNSNELNPWSIYWVHFAGDSSEKMYKRFLQNDQMMVQHVPYDENRIKLFEQTYSILEHSFNEKELEISNFNLLNFVSSLIYHKEANPDIYSTDTINNSISFMKHNINEKFTIEELSEQQNISVSHYSRTFKQKTGSSPINYFNQLKIQKSCQFLHFTDRSVKEISSELGFEDPYYFSRLFRNIVGMSPTMYKKQHKK